MRGAFIGFGNVAETTHLPAWQKVGDMKIVSVVETSPSRREAAHRLLPGVRVYDSIASLLETDRPDFVDVCTPPSSHAEAICAAARAGVAVMCEKPLALTREQMAAIREASQKALVYPIHNWKFSPQMIWVREQVEKGVIGEPLFFAWRTLRVASDKGTKDAAPDWRLRPEIAGGGIVFDHGWHAFSMALGVLKQRPARVSARIRAVREGLPVEDTASLRVEFERADAQIYLSWAAGVRRSEGEVVGTAGVLRVDDQQVALSLGGTLKGRTFPEALSARSQHPDWFLPVIEDFVAELQNPSRRGAALAEAEHCLALALGAYTSHHHGGEAVPVSDTGCDRSVVG